MYNELALRRIIGAVEEYFCSDKIQLAAWCLPLVNKPCSMLEYLINFWSSLWSSVTIHILNNFFVVFWNSMTFFCLSNIVSKSDGLNPSKYKSSFVSSIYFQSFFLVFFDFVKGRVAVNGRREYMYIYILFQKNHGQYSAKGFRWKPFYRLCLMPQQLHGRVILVSFHICFVCICIQVCLLLLYRVFQTLVIHRKSISSFNIWATLVTMMSI